MTLSANLALIEQMLIDVGYPAEGHGEPASVTLADLGLDSLTLLELLMLVEERAGIELRVEEVPMDSTLADVATLIGQRQAR
jgi:acyl carrier protein